MNQDFNKLLTRISNAIQEYQQSQQAPAQTPISLLASQPVVKRSNLSKDREDRKLMIANMTFTTKGGTVTSYDALGNFIDPAKRGRTASQFLQLVEGKYVNPWCSAYDAQGRCPETIMNIDRSNWHLLRARRHAKWMAKHGKHAV